MGTKQQLNSVPTQHSLEYYSIIYELDPEKNKNKNKTESKNKPRISLMMLN